jgi:ABC-2 type transport system permease protein
MKQDLLTVLWKERKGLLLSGGSVRRTLLTQLISIATIALVLPLQLGTDWFSSGFSVLVSVVTPLLLVGTTLPAAFAGEREKHTLETLLASRLPDRAILYGKMLLGILYGWTMTIILFLVSAMMVNIFYWSGRVMFFEWRIFLANLVFSLLFSIFIASLGVIISMRSPTIQGAQQTLIFTILVPLMVLQVIPIILFTFVPDGRQILNRIVESVSFTQLIGILGVILVLLDIGLIFLSQARFTRSKLLFD